MHNTIQLVKDTQCNDLLASLITGTQHLLDQLQQMGLPVVDESYFKNELRTRLAQADDRIWSLVSVLEDQVVVKANG